MKTTTGAEPCPQMPERQGKKEHESVVEKVRRKQGERPLSMVLENSINTSALSSSKGESNFYGLNSSSKNQSLLWFP